MRLFPIERVSLMFFLYVGFVSESIVLCNCESGMRMNCIDLVKPTVDGGSLSMPKTIET